MKTTPAFIHRSALSLTACGALLLLATLPQARAQTENTATGFEALFSITTGDANTADGSTALHQTDTGSHNTGVGTSALLNNTSGDSNTAIGFTALFNNTTGNGNQAIGGSTLFHNTTGTQNTAVGAGALLDNTTASLNSAFGSQALVHNTTGASNTANGFSALFSNATGFNNVADGDNALFNNTTGTYNTASGSSALFRNTTGGYNTAMGVNALYRNTTGNSNIALGVSAGSFLTTGSNNIDIGNGGVATESGRIRIGTKGKQISTFIVGISGVAVPGGVGVIVDTNGKLGTVVSSARFKKDIKPMEQASESILSLTPVTFRYKQELDPAGIAQFGLVAEEVEKVNPDLVARDENGKAYTVRYEAVNAMLLNEFLKEHRKVEELGAAAAQQQKDFQSAIAQQQKEIGALTKALKEQAAQIQKVSAQMSVREAITHTVADNQ
jgi:hypothetical protein